VARASGRRAPPSARRGRAGSEYLPLEQSSPLHASTATAPRPAERRRRRSSVCEPPFSSNPHVTLRLVAKRLIIAIDGPSGAGKGTVARELAARLGYAHLDTGAMYRAVAWKAVKQGLSLADEDAVALVAEHARLDVGP